MREKEPATRREVAGLLWMSDNSYMNLCRLLLVNFITNPI